MALIAVPYAITEAYYVNIASQILLYAIFALGLNILVGYAGLVSLGHAGLFGVASYAVASLLVAGYGHTVAILGALAVGLVFTAGFAALSLRATGISFIMITLALGEILWGLAYRWISLTNGDNGVNVTTRPMPFGIALSSATRVLRHDADRVRSLSRGDRDLRALAVRRRARRHPRPAAAHECARLSRLDDPVRRLHVLRIAHRRRRHLVRLLQQVHQPADLGAAGLGGGAADGDLRRRRYAARPDRRRGAGGHHQERGQRLCGALEFHARRHLRRHRRVHAGRSGAGHGAAVALGVAGDERREESRSSGQSEPKP